MPLKEIDEYYPTVVANIIGPVLIEIASELVARVNSGGTLLLSGLLETQKEEVLLRYGEVAQAAGRSLELLRTAQEA